ILKRLTSLSSESEAHLSRLPLTSLVEEVTAPHRDFGISIKLRPGERIGPEPVGRRNPGVIYGLGNLVENAADF
ncbi:MAG: sensor histidine kinase, partial [Mesorhizobium sp.]